MIPSDQIHTYLVNEKLDQKIVQRANKEYDHIRDMYLVKSGLYQDSGGGTLVFRGVPVGTLWRTAAEQREAQLDLQKKAHFASEAGAGRFPTGTPQNPKGEKAKTAKPFKPPNLRPQDYLEQPFKEAYDKAIKAWESSPDAKAAEESRQALLNTGETLGGPDGTTKQVEVGWLRGHNHKTIGQAVLRALRAYDPNTDEGPAAAGSVRAVEKP
jgi:hypothetical protein